MGENENYDKQTGKCADWNKSVESGLHIVSWLKPEKEYGLVGAEDLVISESKARVLFTFPLAGDHEFEVEGAGNGITRKELIDFICETYEFIYKKEDQVSPVLPQHEQVKCIKREDGWMNFVCLGRPSSKGPYGIHDYYLDDIYLDGISYDPKTNLVTLSIGSD